MTSARRYGAGANPTACRSDQPPGAAQSRERGRDRRQQAPVGVGDHRFVDVPARDCELLAQHDDVEVLRAARTSREASQRNEEAVDDPIHEDSASARVATGQTTTAEFPAPTGANHEFISQGIRACRRSARSRACCRWLLRRLDSGGRFGASGCRRVDRGHHRLPGMHRPHSRRRRHRTAARHDLR